MRFPVCGLLFAAIASPAIAGDNSWLRGSTTDFPTPQPYVRWSGLYAGGQMGVDFHGIDFRTSPQAAIGNIMAQDAALALLPVIQLAALPAPVRTGPSFGGFVGYNYQFDDVVLGLETNFNWSSLNASASEFRTRDYVLNLNSHSYSPVTVNLSDGATIVLNDYGSFRMRGGWTFDNFLPYVLFGLTVSQINTYRIVNVNYHGTDVTPQTCPTTPCPPNPKTPPLIPIGANYTQADQSHGKYIFGFSGGIGLDYALTRSLFLRGEVEYLQLGNVNGIKLNTTSIRTGLGLRF
jgi:outer membrane immunogenic protein